MGDGARLKDEYGAGGGTDLDKEISPVCLGTVYG